VAESSFFVAAQAGGTSKRQAKAIGRKPFFFEKKNQKTFAKLGRAYPDRPKPKSSNVFASFFKKEVLSPLP
jgi:hypothetical protein